MTPEQGRRLRKLMERQRRDGETWSDVAQRLGVQKAAMYQWWRGKAEVSPGSLEKMAAAFGMTRAAIVAEMDGERQ